MAEMTVTLTDDTFSKAKIEMEGQTRVCSVENTSGKSLKIYFDGALPYGVKGIVNSKELYRKVDTPFFKNLIADILSFFENGKIPFDSEQTLKVMQLRDLLLKADKSIGNWVEFDD